MSGESKADKPFTDSRRTEAKAAEYLPPLPPVQPGIQVLSEKGLEFIGRWEGTRLEPYNDSANYATIGVGHLIAYRPVNDADKAKYAHFTEADAIHLLKLDAARFEAPVRGLGLHLTQNEFDALVSFAFNLGAGALSHIAQLLHAGDKVGAMNVLMQYDHAGGVEVAGLKNRRTAERKLFLEDVYR